VTLYDGATTLGTKSGLGLGATFVGSGAEVRRDWVGYSLNVVDFSSMLDGTIQGRLELQVFSGSSFELDPSLLKAKDVMLMEVTDGWGAARGDFDWVTVIDTSVASVELANTPLARTSLAAPVPISEPTTLALLGVGFVGLTIQRCRTRKKGCE
jgi:hypothetical protein